MRARTAGTLLVLSLLLPSPSAAAKSAKPAGFPEEVRGVTISTHGNGRDWGSTELMRPVMQEIQRIGGGWVAIHPYAAIRADGSVRMYSMHSDRAADSITRPIEMAHALGLRVLIKPHLGYWGSPFRWRGEIEFGDEASWQRFWTDYEKFILRVAELSKNADGFVVGTELDRTLEHDKRWRQLIARVREKTAAPLTYAANWTDYRRVGFWDDLDAIGIQAYFPVADRERPDEATVRRGWATVMTQLSAYSKKQKKPILFTELGYNHSYAAAQRPWESRNDGEDAVPLKETCMRVALEAVKGEPAVIGAFLWKWFPEPHPVGRNFRLATPGIKSLIRKAWM